MSNLFLLRHFKSQWNLENRFTGWTDIPLIKDTSKIAKKQTKKIFENKIDIIYTSSLFRNMQTVAEIFKFLPDKYPIFIHLDDKKMKNWGKFKSFSKNELLVYVSSNLNERYYGSLQGLNKEETIKKYGEKKVHLWRRSYDIKPPKGESLKDVYERTTPFYKRYIEKDLRKGKNILLVASHNSLRALVKYIEKIPNEEIINLEIPFGGMIEYTFDKNLKIKNKSIF
ncbi:MAG TPA: histidine phosphatase family protein [Candidatus Pacearchaeota archaeon]|nr:histidine phosphatase family protein [Candidatus Pacearchaeota archaeon]HOL90480.1 histidine phosphatase family protein [Candidatus Pacearchaeota archaeon]HPO68452.1 histidine phosphatase family protein [Candidatus Pacearchaeota archaeon]